MGIASHQEYVTIQARERTFARLVQRMENSHDPTGAHDDPDTRQAKIDATRHVLTDIRDQIRRWENRPLIPPDRFEETT